MCDRLRGLSMNSLVKYTIIQCAIEDKIHHAMQKVTVEGSSIKLHSMGSYPIL